MWKPETGHDYVIGCDWGRSNDYTVFTVLDTTTRALVQMDRSNRVDYAVQCDRLKALAEQWQPSQTIAEQNSIGQPVIEQLIRDGLRIQSFITSNASKAQAIEALALAFERHDIRILNNPTLISELVAYQAERLPSGQLRYGAPNGGHDDTVMSLALAWSAVSGQRRLIYPFPDSCIVVPAFPIPDHWEQAFALVVRGHIVGVIWAARDPKTDVLYLIDEYWGEDDPAVHVAAIRGRGEWIPRANRYFRQWQGPTGWNPVDGDIWESWSSPTTSGQLARVRNLASEPTNALQAPTGLPLAHEISGRA
jgi:hypothetical protein